MEVIRSAGRILIGKPEVKRSLGGPRSIFKHNFKMDVKEIWIWNG